jgi:hypothetical protein
MVSVANQRGHKPHDDGGRPAEDERAFSYLWSECLPDAESAFYFSGVTYATIGYGELVLPKPWRMLAPIEGLTGILMCGLSAGLFVALANRIFALRSEQSRT